MSKMKEWLLDRQENGDDGSGYCDMCEGCANCTSEGETLQQRADRTNPYLLTTKKEGK